MSVRKLGVIALALGTATLFTAAPLTTAVAQKKKPATKAAAAKAKPVDNKALIAEGLKIYNKNSCGACHAVAGKGGKTGPDLSKFGKTHKVPETIVYIRDPKKKNPQSLMPAYGPTQIDEKQLKGLVAYLLSLK